MTHTSRVGAAIKRRLVPAALFVCLLVTPPAFAQIAQATIDRIVALTVQRYEASFLWNTDQVDRSVWIERRDAIEQELKPLLQQVRALDKDQQQQVNSQITGLTEARLALAKPLWQAKADAFRREREERQRTLMTGVMSDAQKALEPQRRRLLLQERRDRGEITPEEFSSEDKKALDEIMALRSKYATEGQGYDRRFDSELARLTREMAKPQPPPPAPPEAVASNPPAPRPAPKAKTPENPTSDAAYARDVYEAGDLYWGMLEAARRFQEGDFDDGKVNTVKTALEPELQKLITKWRAAGRAAEFEKDYKQAADNRMVAEKAERRKRTWAAVSSWMSAALIFVAIIGGIYVVVLVLRAMGSKPTPGRRVSDAYGTAHYAQVEINAEADCLAGGVFFGKSSAPDAVNSAMDVAGAPICSTPENHTLIVARTRTGKGTRVIVPTLLRYAGSAFVIDPKGENAAITGRVRRDQLHQDVHILNPWNELASTYEGLGFVRATYNPLDILDRNDPNAVAIAQSLAEAICPPPVGEKETFWRGSAGGLLTAVFLWLAHRDKIDEKKTLGRAREIVTVTRAKFRTDYLTQMAACEAFDGAIRELAAYFIDMADETYSGIVANLAETTRFLSDPQVKAATASSTFSMEDLIKKGTTVYLVIPTDRMDTQKTWLRLVVAAAMHTYKRTGVPVASRRRCLFMIDEFAALGRVAELPRDIASMGGCGIDFALVVQGLDQLKDHYGDARGTIMSNCAYQWFCNLNDLDSAEYLSKTLGKKTVETSSTSYSASTGGGGGSSTQSTSHSETARALLNPDEVLNLGKDVAILLQPAGHPHYLRPVDYFNLPAAFAYLQQERPSLYWEPPLTYDQNPYVAASAAEVKMAVEDARKILGVTDAADINEVRMAYLKLLPKLLTKGHPDQGGAGVSVKELNEAKDVLLGLQ